jgi:hypothetical protein
MSKKRDEYGTEDLEQLAFDAMRRCGMVLPLTIEEVAAIESELPCIKLPFGPSDPMVLLASLASIDRDDDLLTLPFPTVDTDTARNLARAAREGGTLSAEIERRMAEDKSKHQASGNVQQ